MQKGWIKVFREFSQWEWFHKPEMVQIFIYLLLKANSEDAVFEGEIIPRGSLVTSVKNLSWGTHLTPQVVRTCLERLKLTNEITSKSTNKYTIITLCSYDKYQCSQNEVNKQNNEQTSNQITNNQQTNNKQITNNQQQYKNIRNKEDNIIINNGGNNVRTHTCEEEYIADMLNNQSWLELMAMRFKLPIAKIIKKIQEFEIDSQCRVVQHQNDADAKRHFNDWLRIQLQQQKKEQSNGTKQLNNKKDTGIHFGATSAEDYEDWIQN